ncbi:MAG: acyltransferase family protein [Pseudobdellovibrionaceae bacterium]
MTIESVPHTKKSTPVLENLQVLRGLAALMIVLLHSRAETAEMFKDTQSAFLFFRYPLLLGIDLFFVLSGFVMVYTSQGRFADKTYPKEFILRRLLRVAPLYWFYTLLLVGVALILPQVLDSAQLDVMGVIKSILFIPYENGQGVIQPFLALGWTLNYEMFFYVIFAALLFLPMLWAIMAMSVIFVGLSLMHPYVSSDQAWAVFYTKPIILDFLAGSWIGWLWTKGVRPPRAVLGYCVAACFSLLLVPVAFELGGIKVDYLIVQPLLAIAIVALLALPKGSESFSCPKPFKKLGDISYTLYLSHPFVIGAVTQGLALTGLINRASPSFVVLTCLIGATAVAYILYFLLERPLLRVGKRLILRSNQNAQPKPFSEWR